ncbi:MAG: OsmC family protein [Ignavibacteriae bacterium]|nr:OsmC family protein [Ignavibacteriota bacterium]MCB9208231.1 OsmC family protein [Ignavibacteriales bacterium]MCB9258993.1 OsmC family protein [Ignavibacteriales bacterium]
MNFNIPHSYKVTANAIKDKTYKVSAENLPIIETAPPKNFGGPGNIWSPEDLFVATIANCFLMTFKAVSTLSKLDWLSLDVNAEGILDRVDSKLQFTEVIIKAFLKIPKDGNEERAIRIMHKAEQNCLVTNSLKTNVTLKPSVIFS